MKMKKLLTTICAITGVLSFVAPTALSVFANADGLVDGVSPDTFEE